MNYLDFIKSEFENRNWTPVADAFRNIEGKNILIFTHDDPDGLTAGCILKRLVEKQGAVATVRLPASYELDEALLDQELQKDDYHMVIVSDKGSMGYYDNYVNKVEKFVVIDHHPPIGEIKECFFINPNIGQYNMCSTSFLANMLSNYLGITEKCDDYLALLGMKGDWAVEPATDIVSEYVDIFYRERVEGAFDSLIEKIDSRPTMFEVNQRDKTTLLNQIAELYFALGGGGFQYFYNHKDEDLKDLDQSRFSFDIMADHCNNLNHESWGNLDDFMKDTPDPKKVERIYEFFLADWKKVTKSFSNTTLLTSLAGNDIYVFLGNKVPLMPMAGSVYLYELKKKYGKDNIVFIMLEGDLKRGYHFSLRGTSDNIHCGKICSNLAKRFVEKYGFKDQITGGGHYRAAECKTRNSGVRLTQSLEVFSALIMDMELADGEGNPDGGLKLGLEYLGE
jgi:hypothetical protein